MDDLSRKIIIPSTKPTTSQATASKTMPNVMSKGSTEEKSRWGRVAKDAREAHTPQSGLKNTEYTNIPMTISIRTKAKVKRL